MICIFRSSLSKQLWESREFEKRAALCPGRIMHGMRLQMHFNQ